MGAAADAPPQCRWGGLAPTLVAPRCRRPRDLPAQALVSFASFPPPRQTAQELRERFFGDELEMQSYGKAYGIIWEHDAADTAYRPGTNGETVVEVATRIRALIEVGGALSGCTCPVCAALCTLYLWAAR